jgi:hypothetical protein
MKRIVTLALFAFVLCSGFVCTPVERATYNTFVAAKAFTDQVKIQHPECAAGLVSPLCADLTKAVAAKDLLIDAWEIYCAGPKFNGGGVCDPPAKGTPAFEQASAKMQAAIAAYNQAETDLKAVLK